MVWHKSTTVQNATSPSKKKKYHISICFPMTLTILLAMAMVITLTLYFLPGSLLSMSLRNKKWCPHLWKYKHKKNHKVEIKRQRRRRKLLYEVHGLHRCLWVVLNIVIVNMRLYLTYKQIYCSLICVYPILYILPSETTGRPRQITAAAVERKSCCLAIWTMISYDYLHGDMLLPLIKTSPDWYVLSIIV